MRSRRSASSRATARTSARASSGIRDEFDELQDAYRLPLQGSRAARARADAQVARRGGRVGRRRRQRVARVPRRRRARAGGRRTRCSSSIPTYNEGQKSKIKAPVVSTQSLARHAERLRLGDHLILGRGEEKTGGRFKQALLADGYEALIAAIYLDGGLAAAARFLEREMKDAHRRRARRGNFVGQDFKSALQERLQALGRPLPEYRLSGEAGPDHRKVFSVDVVVGGEMLGSATGKAKKEAEQEAARLALAHLSTADARHDGQAN